MHSEYINESSVSDGGGGNLKEKKSEQNIRLVFST